MYNIFFQRKYHIELVEVRGFSTHPIFLFKIHAGRYFYPLMPFHH